MDLSNPLFWTALATIIGIDIVLSGDNAVVIALASRSLPADQRKKAIFWGCTAAITMRIILTIFAVQLLAVAWLKIVGAILLLWIGIKLLIPEEGGKEIAASDHLGGAIKTILVADLVMSVDNVVAIAAASKDNLVLLMIGLAVSIPFIMFSSGILLKLMDRFPIIITVGAALLGYVAGEMLITDPASKAWVNEHAYWMHYVVPLLGAVLVVVVGLFLAKRHEASPASTVETASESS